MLGSGGANNVVAFFWYFEVPSFLDWKVRLSSRLYNCKSK